MKSARGVAEMEEEMKEAEEEMTRRKREAEMLEEKDKKKLKIATPGFSERGTPRTPMRSRYGL